jgi:hypothetical protein
MVVAGRLEMGKTIRVMRDYVFVLTMVDWCHFLKTKICIICVNQLLVEGVKMECQ